MVLVSLPQILGVCITYLVILIQLYSGSAPVSVSQEGGRRNLSANFNGSFNKANII